MPKHPGNAEFFNWKDTSDEWLTTEIKKSERDIDLNFQKVSVLLQLKKLTLYIKFINPEIQYKFTKIPLDKLRANINLASLLKNEISIKKIEMERKVVYS